MSEQSVGRVRASDAEREQVAVVLRDAMGEGRLTLAEGEERMAAAYAVTYRDELPPLTVDLPAAEPPSTHWPGTRHAPRAVDGPGPRRRPTGPWPRISLPLLAALLAWAWVLTGDGPLWPAIILGVLALMILKRRARYRLHHAPAGRRGPGCGADAGAG